MRQCFDERLVTAETRQTSHLWPSMQQSLPSGYPPMQLRKSATINVPYICQYPARKNYDSEQMLNQEIEYHYNLDFRNYLNTLPVVRVM